MASSQRLRFRWPFLGAALVLAAAVACAPQRAAAPADAPQAAPKEQQQSAAPQMTLKFSHVVAEKTPKHRGAVRFAELVKQKSNGRIEVQVFPNSQLYKDGEEFEALQTGAIHFIAPGTDKFGVIAPEWEATALPYIFTSEEAAQKFLDPDNEVAQFLFEKLRAKGMLGMAIWQNGFKHFSDAKRPLIKPEDFQGLKFRTSGKPDEAFVKALGGSAQVMAFSEVFSALQQGVVDGQLNTWNNILTQKFHEVQKYATIGSGGAFLTYGVATNAQWWDGLDAQSQKIIGEAMKEATVYSNQIASEENSTAFEQIKASGRLEFHTQTKEEAAEWAQVATKVHAEWESRTGKEIIENLKALNQ